MNSVRVTIRSHAAPALLMLAATFLVYGRSLGNGFMTGWDDGLYVVNNTVAHGITPEHLWLAFSRIFGGNYAPAQIISYMVDYQYLAPLKGLPEFGRLLAKGDV